MSRISAFDAMCGRMMSNNELIWENITAPPLYTFFNQADIDGLTAIASSIRYNSNIQKKRSAIDAIMNPRGFYRAFSGTNRLVYNFIEDDHFCAKVAIDKVGMKDTPAEFINQQYFAPFCCKIFEPCQSGVIGLIERVHPITSIEEFASVANDVFNMLVGVFIGRFVADDIGIHSYMNYGVRIGFGPVLLDFPYFYELDGDKLRCNNLVDTPLGKVPCGGTIDYDGSFDFLVCPKCGKRYKAIDLGKKSEYHIPMVFDNEDKKIARLYSLARARVIDNGRVVLDSGASSKTILSKEELAMNNFGKDEVGLVRVDKTFYGKRVSVKQNQKDWTALQEQYYHELAAKNSLKPARVATEFELDDDAEHERIKNTRVGSAPATPTTQIKISNYNPHNGDGFMELVIDEDFPGKAYSAVRTLEKETFPEMTEVITNPTVEYVPVPEKASKQEEDIPEPTETSELEVPQEEAIPQSKVDKMVGEVKEQCNPTQEEATSTVLDPEEDATNPMSSPMSRPYAGTPFPVSVFDNSKIGAAEQRTAMEQHNKPAKGPKPKKFKPLGPVNKGDERKNREQRRREKRGF